MVNFYSQKQVILISGNNNNNSKQIKSFGYFSHEKLDPIPLPL